MNASASAGFADRGEGCQKRGRDRTDKLGGGLDLYQDRGSLDQAGNAADDNQR